MVAAFPFVAAFPVAAALPFAEGFPVEADLPFADAEEEEEEAAALERLVVGGAADPFRDPRPLRAFSARAVSLVPIFTSW
ncbi:MAG TPA: hypothetical protein RMF84_05800 [Polyangiaceae bacterium LLY-WYZ-14_1]|nr:hypothetical protein [Polyangiaceae bacterium LLY-WYZ-14_1]